MKVSYLVEMFAYKLRIIAEETVRLTDGRLSVVRTDRYSDQRRTFDDLTDQIEETPTTNALRQMADTLEGLRLIAFTFTRTTDYQLNERHRRRAALFLRNIFNFAELLDLSMISLVLKTNLSNLSNISNFVN